MVKALERFLDQVIKKITLDIVANLKSAPNTGYGTPVDTGWARANWVPNIGARRDGTAGTRAQAEAAATASTAEQDAGVAKVAISYTTKQGPVHITNNVPYILKLNEGTSRQAPRGFVQNAIVKAIRRDLAAGLRGV